MDEQVILQKFICRLHVNQLSRGGGVRYCDSCELIKPDRCHHCSVCNRYVHIWILCHTMIIDFIRCILKMDHHCPWLLLLF